MRTIINNATAAAIGMVHTIKSTHIKGDIRALLPLSHAHHAGHFSLHDHGQEFGKRLAYFLWIVPQDVDTVVAACARHHGLRV